MKYSLKGLAALLKGPYGPSKERFSFRKFFLLSRNKFKLTGPSAPVNWSPSGAYGPFVRALWACKQASGALCRALYTGLRPVIKASMLGLRPNYKASQGPRGLYLLRKYLGPLGPVRALNTGLRPVC